MLEVVIAAALALPSAYTSDSLHVFAAVANDRVIDGITYSDGNGVLSAGLLYAHSRGFFASSELSGFHGNGELLPDDTFMSLETVAGWRILSLRGHEVNVSLLDYRLRGNNDAQAHQGVTLAWSAGRLSVDAGIERDASYFVAYRNRFVAEDVRHFSISWQEPAGDDMRFNAAIGLRDFTGVDVDYHYLSAGLQGNWRTFEWQVSLVHAGDGVNALGTRDADGLHWQLRLAAPIRLF